MPSKLKNLWYRAIALVDKGANQEADIVIAKAEHQYASMDECMAAEQDEGKCKELMAAMKRAATLGESMSEKLPEDVIKAALAEVADLKKRLEHADEVRTKAEARITKMEDEHQRKVFIAKAQEFTALPGVTPDDFGPILRKIAGVLSEDELKKLDATLRGAARIAEQSEHFKELGTGQPAVGSALEKLNQKAQAMVEEIAKSGGHLTFAQAFAKVCDREDGKVLYRQYEQEEASKQNARRVR